MRRILLVLLAALLALMPMSMAYAAPGQEEDRDVEDIEVNLEDLDLEDLDIEFKFRPFRAPVVEIEIAPGVEIEVPFFAGLGLLLRRNLFGLGLFGARRFIGVEDLINLNRVNLRDVLRDR